MIQNEVREAILNSPMGYSNIIRFKYPDFKDWIINNYLGSSFGEKLYNWYVPVVDNTCIYCKSITKFDQFSNGYQKFCNCSCRAKHYECFKFGISDEAIAKKAITYNNKDAIEKSKIIELRLNTINQKYSKDEQREYRTKGIQTVQSKLYSEDVDSK